MFFLIIFVLLIAFFYKLFAQFRKLFAHIFVYFNFYNNKYDFSPFVQFLKPNLNTAILPFSFFLHNSFYFSNTIHFHRNLVLKDILYAAAVISPHHQYTLPFSSYLAIHFFHSERGIVKPVYIYIFPGQDFTRSVLFSYNINFFSNFINLEFTSYFYTIKLFIFF